MEKLCVLVRKLGVDPQGRKDPGIYIGPFDTAEELIKWVEEAGFHDLIRGWVHPNGYGVRDFIVQDGYVLHAPSEVKLHTHDFLPIFDHIARGGRLSD